MKKQLSILLVLFFVSATITSINAQISGLPGLDPTFESFKLHGTKPSEDDVLTNIRKKFQKQFANAKLESWTKLNKGYAIRFSAASIENLVFYDTKANITGQVRYYKPDYLPFDIRFQVESTYYDYDILSVQEVIVEKSVTYLVSIAAKNEWKIIRVNETGMDVYKEYRRG
jgi:hypothetical protein